MNKKDYIVCFYDHIGKCQQTFYAKSEEDAKKQCHDMYGPVTIVSVKQYDKMCRMESYIL